MKTPRRSRGAREAARRRRARGGGVSDSRPGSGESPSRRVAAPRLGATRPTAPPPPHLPFLSFSVSLPVSPSLSLWLSLALSLSLARSISLSRSLVYASDSRRGPVSTQSRAGPRHAPDPRQQITNKQRDICTNQQTNRKICIRDVHPARPPRGSPRRGE